MPQKSLLMWLSLFIVFSTALILFNTMSYYLFNTMNHYLNQHKSTKAYSSKNITLIWKL